VASVEVDQQRKIKRELLSTTGKGCPIHLKEKAQKSELSIPVGLGSRKQSVLLKKEREREMNKCSEQRYSSEKKLSG